MQNLVTGDRGLHIIRAGSAEAVFEVFSPYIIVAKINDIDDPDDDTDASVVTLEAAAPVALAVSLDHGLTWQHAGQVAANAKGTVDLTRLVRGTYGYLLKLTTSGTPGQAAIRSLSIDTWVQVAPISLPRLKRGENHLRYDVGDRYGLRTVPVLVNPDTSNPEDLKKYMIAMPDDYDPRRNTSRIRGDAVLRLAAPRGTKIAWFSVGATFRTNQGEQAATTANTISWAADEPRDFKEIYRASAPRWVNHWRYNWDTDVMLNRPVEEVFVKFHGEPGLNTMRACLHVVPDGPTRTDVRISHAYNIDGRQFSRTVDLASPTEYTISCDGDPENVSVTMAVPSNPGLTATRVLQ